MSFQDDLGESGLAMLALCIDDKWNLLGWADSNNMKNGLREELLKSLTSQDHHMVEICYFRYTWYFREKNQEWILRTWRA